MCQNFKNLHFDETNQKIKKVFNKKIVLYNKPQMFHNLSWINFKSFSNLKINGLSKNCFFVKKQNDAVVWNNLIVLFFF